MAPYKSSAGRNLGKLVQSFLSESIGSTIRKQQSTVSGGVIVEDGGYRYHVFTGSGTLFVAGIATPDDTNLLLVGPGGGGGGRLGGGGGGGGVRNFTNFPIPTGSYSVTIEAGGPSMPVTYPNGAKPRGPDATIINSSDSSVLAYATGGGGGSADNGGSATDGGSGGGGTSNGGSGGGDTLASPDGVNPTVQGYPGGDQAGAGGGGAGGSPPGAGIGGDGASISWISAPTFSPLFPAGWVSAVGPTGLFAGGGGGTGYYNPAPQRVGGPGGGGAGGGQPASPGIPGVDNTGGGGGGGAQNGGASGSGGKGVCFIRYPI